MDDPFSILSLPRQFNLTAAEVASAHLRTVSRLHPDRATDLVQRERLVRESAAAGAAKQRLLYELPRAEVLLELLGARSFSAVPLAPSFLMETLELREAIEEACVDQSSETHQALAAEVEALRAEVIARLQAAFAVALTEPGNTESVHTAAQQVVRLRYLERMQTRLRGDA